MPLSRRTLIRCIALAAISALVPAPAATVPRAAAQSPPPVKVGFSSAMTGPSAITGEGVKWAAQMMADEYNAKGGIMGRKIELYFGDNAGTPGEAVSAVRKLVDVDKVDVIIGQTHSGACLGALPVVKELAVPMVIEACSNPKIRDLIGKTVNEWAFRVNPDDVMLANQFAKYMSQHVKTVSIFAQNDDFGRGAATAYDAAFKKVGIKLVSTEFFDRGQADYRPVLTRVKRASPEGVLLVMLASEGSVFMRQFRELGLTQKLFARGSMATPEFLFQVRDSPAIADGLVEATYWTPAIDPEWDKRWLERWKVPVRIHGSLAAIAFRYAVAPAIEQAIKKTGKADRKSIRDLAGTLSGGQQQILEMAIALLLHPRLLLLDEPSLGLDPRMVEAVFSTIVAINREGTAVLMVEQNAKQALAISHRGFVLELGRNRFEGTGQALLDDPEVRAHYLGG